MLGAPERLLREVDVAMRPARKIGREFVALARRFLMPAPLILVATLAAGGCTIGTYKQPVDTFADATKKANDAYAGLQQSIIQAHVERLKQQAMAQRLQVRRARGDCELTSQSCGLEVVPRDGAPIALTINPSRFSNLVAVMQGVTTYATNLQAIVAADTAKQVTEQTAAAVASAEQIAKTAKDNNVAPDVADVVTANAEPVANLANWLVGEYVNALQVSGLRKATEHADPVIAEIARALNVAANGGGDAVNEPLVKAYGEAQDARANVSERGSRAALDRLVTAAANLDTALHASDPTTFTDMAAAHHALTQRLAGEHVSLADVSAAIQQFAAKAEQLQKLVERPARRQQARREAVTVAAFMNPASGSYHEHDRGTDRRRPRRGARVTGKAGEPTQRQHRRDRGEGLPGGSRLHGLRAQPARLPACLVERDQRRNQRTGLRHAGPAEPVRRGQANACRY